MFLVVAIVVDQAAVGNDLALIIGQIAGSHRHLGNGAVPGVRAEEVREDGADLAFALAAGAFDEHHTLTAVGGEQAVADKFLKNGDILRIKQVIKALKCSEC